MIQKSKNIIAVAFFTIFLTACDGPETRYNEDLTGDLFICSDSKLVDFVSSLDIYIIDKAHGWYSENWLRRNNKGHKIIIDKIKIKQIVSELMYNKRPETRLPHPRLSGERLDIILTMTFGSKAYIKIYGFKDKSNKVWIVDTYSISAYQIFPSKSLQEIFSPELIKAGADPI
jgi:hypothetical protein